MLLTKKLPLNKMETKNPEEIMDLESQETKTTFPEKRNLENLELLVSPLLKVRRMLPLKTNNLLVNKSLVLPVNLARTDLLRLLKVPPMDGMLLSQPLIIKKVATTRLELKTETVLLVKAVTTTATTETIKTDALLTLKTESLPTKTSNTSAKTKPMPSKKLLSPKPLKPIE